MDRDRMQSHHVARVDMTEVSGSCDSGYGVGFLSFLTSAGSAAPVQPSSEVWLCTPFPETRSIVNSFSPSSDSVSHLISCFLKLSSN